jgi:hypothetical protein
MRAAAGSLSLLLSLGFGLPCAIGIWHFARTGEVWTFLGFPTYGDGPFERIGIHTNVALLAGFLAVCVAEGVIGALLLRDASYAPALAHGLLPFELAFWVGFALPFGPPLGVARSVLLLLA